MHLLAATPGQALDPERASDLGQTPAEIVVLSSADTELAGLSSAWSSVGGSNRLRLASPMQLRHNLSVDLYVDAVVSSARVVVVRLLGGRSYWPYGVERLVETARTSGVALALLPGDERPDPDLDGLSTIDRPLLRQMHDYFREGGRENLCNLLRLCDRLAGGDAEPLPPRPLLRAGFYWPGLGASDLETIRGRWTAGRPAAALVFYRALLQSDDLAPVDALVDALRDRGLNALPVFVSSLKEPIADTLIRETFAAEAPDIVLNLTAFAVRSGGDQETSPLEASGCPILQVVLAGDDAATWGAGTRGLNPRDLAMAVALPELDGRILSRAISFKGERAFDRATECLIRRHEPRTDRVAFVAELAAAWVRLRRCPVGDRRIAIVMANYPNRDGRIGNGVGLDTPASAAVVFGALRAAGYDAGAAPEDAARLIELLLAGPTNASRGRGGVRLSLTDYRAAYDAMPPTVRRTVEDRWGAPERDPFFADGAFTLPVHLFGNTALGIQPARGYNIDPKATYHDPALPPPHGYLAFYLWLRQRFGAMAVIHLGKHGNLEWLPGKALALSDACFPEAAFGPMPHLYPFIVNDPGEGTQAKRRAQAVIVDHLTPPLGRAELHGDLTALERAIDEYFDASGSDPRRLPVLAQEIRIEASRIGLDRDLAIGSETPDDEYLRRLDAQLCDLKEMQIRDGLHVFGHPPDGPRLDALLVALARLPRNHGAGGDASLLRALSLDLGLGDFDPLGPDLAAPWVGERPDALARVSDAPWRTAGDTVERLELLAIDLVAGRRSCAPGWTASAAVLDFIARVLRPMVLRSGEGEISGLLRGLSGAFVPPGPSGAPTRGRLDVLPTGRNFYSVDTRAVPTPAAWMLGWKSAAALLDRHRQDHGEWPRRLALSAWGTANMRTGGDDIAQALALIGVRPTWDGGSRRVTGFEVLPLEILGRPRVDVTLRVSGFFRDAFPALMELFDAAVREVGGRDEPADLNPLAQRMAEDAASLRAAGVDDRTARRRASYRIFGSRPGAYGAGLQALIDEGEWNDGGDLANAFIGWSAYAYGVDTEGASAEPELRSRIAGLDAVLHNQDNREHDILDSDDYYQFEGGLAAAARVLKGHAVPVYHNDHSRPERPRIRTLAEEIARVVRGRAANPKWIAGCMRHGYKGAFEMAATVDYLFAFAATAGAVGDWHFDQLYDAYIADPEVRSFIAANNRPALREIAARFLEAERRGLWRPRSNSALAELSRLTETIS